MSPIVRELVVGTLRTSLLTVGTFLTAYGVLVLLSGSEELSVGFVAFGGMVVFGLLMSLPFAIPLVLAGIAGRIFYNRLLLASVPSKSLRTWVLTIAVAGLGLLTVWLWLTVQGLEDMASELMNALFLAGTIGGGTAGFSGAKGGPGV